MAKIAVARLFLADVLMTLGTDTYEQALSQVVFTPSSSTVTFTGLDGTTFSDSTPATWACGLTFLQDWETADSLSQYLLENEGETVAAIFKPRSGSGPTFTSTLSITPGAIGGQVGQHAVATVTLGATKPVLVPAA